MGKVGTGFSMSLDGFIAGPGDDVQQVFKWFSSGDTEVKYPGGRVVVKVSPESAELLREQIETTGALVTGRRQFDLTHGWGGRHLSWLLSTSVRNKSFFFGFSYRFLTSDI